MDEDEETLVVHTEQPWEPHPLIADAQLAYHLTARESRAQITCALVRLGTGVRPPAHRHESSSDIFYVLRGRGWIWVEKHGDIELSEGMFVRIPRGLWHRPHDIAEDLLLFNVWAPALI